MLLLLLLPVCDAPGAVVSPGAVPLSTSVPIALQSAACPGSTLAPPGELLRDDELEGDRLQSDRTGSTWRRPKPEPEVIPPRSVDCLL